MKPRLRMVNGQWLCDGLAGPTPRAAFDRWRLAVEPWRVIPCGFVPRVYKRPA